MNWQRRKEGCSTRKVVHSFIQPTWIVHLFCISTPGYLGHQVNWSMCFWRVNTTSETVLLIAGGPYMYDLV